MITEIIRIPLLWGEEFSIPVGTANSWKYVADFASILILFFISDASIRLWKNGNQFTVREFLLQYGSQSGINEFDNLESNLFAEEAAKKSV